MIGILKEKLFPQEGAEEAKNQGIDILDAVELVGIHFLHILCGACDCDV